MDVLTEYPVRKNKKQKAAFRRDVAEYLSGIGYAVNEEKGSMGAINLVAGDPEKAKYLITAHYDTCARMIVPNLITPCSFLGFMGYQLILTVLMLLGAALVGVTGWALISLVAVIMGDPVLDAFVYGLPLIGPFSWIGIWVILVLMMFGPANPSNANDNTSGVVTLLEIARTLPENQRHKVCFVLFDLEEAGLIGSSCYRKAHKKATDGQLVVNLDCVGEGDHIRFFPTKKLRKDRKKLTSLYKACGYFGKKFILVQEKGFSIYPSDQANFPYGIGVCALNQRKKLLYLGRIHTPKDTILDATNVNILRAALTTLISSDAAQ